MFRNSNIGFAIYGKGECTVGDLTVKETNVNQLMVTYYNVLNIYAYRMRMNPDEQLILRGCDPEEKDGQACAEKVKIYLVNNFLMRFKLHQRCTIIFP